MSKVIYEKRDRIAYITLNRPEAMNALDDELNRELWKIWTDFDQDKRIDIAILTGSGRAFCAGADLKTYMPKVENWTPLDVCENTATGIAGGLTRGQHKIYKPIIAAVNGYALAGGLELALACDIRIASEKAILGSFEPRRGFHHADGGIVRLVAIAGIATALELCLTAREIPAEEAYRLRLVNKVVPHDELLPTAEAYANMILENSQRAIRSAKKTIFEIIGRSLDDALNLEAIYGYASVGDFKETTERLQKFYNKNKK
jgi:enoyl-CoA hydratase/carnithine racemase